ncbi:transglutaminase-like cysteine peptidase [Bosea beijingensis]|uniref:transglutaminase-like cysteine peptidase n=1 Tax=Bosea beijingensis TaxID=3068632 RepID=UPI00274282C9|nr:transglutaminase-like cysteine peptidase [Bosea sp. REN20]
MISLARSCFAIAAIIAAQFCLSPASANGLTDLAHLHAGQAALPPMGWGQFCNANPGDCIPQRTVRQTVALTDSRWAELVEINLRFNKAIEPVTDLDQFGVVERWTYATTGKGDCEDYVLEKRRELLRRGWPISSLLVTVVIDREGGGHAVLTVVTDRGEFVLDNQIDKILSWSNSGLTFIKRQSPTNQNDWQDLGRLLGRPDVVTASITPSR